MTAHKLRLSGLQSGLRAGVGMVIVAGDIRYTSSTIRVRRIVVTVRRTAYISTGFDIYPPKYASPKHKQDNTGQRKQVFSQYSYNERMPCGFQFYEPRRLNDAIPPSANQPTHLSRRAQTTTSSTPYTHACTHRLHALPVPISSMISGWLRCDDRLIVLSLPLKLAPPPFHP